MRSGGVHMIKIIICDDEVIFQNKIKSVLENIL